MRLTQFSDFAVRVMLYLAAHTERLCSVGEIAGAYEISDNHLMKVVSKLAAEGYIKSVRGRNGGIRLGRPATEINIGKLIRYTEGHIDLVGCAQCKLNGVCNLPGPLDLALAAFFAVLERYSLADVLGTQDGMRMLRQLAIVSRSDNSTTVTPIRTRLKPG
ncbi:MAG: Rrf2 family transcriptional regulator [Acidovorax sp.]|uniref:RrF2 family transcriptional regulator n=1 Tax=Acidovorax sp. 106 TaxID=2135637 RepID=UPI000EB0D6F0|nr:Rrf2 family transcriptional regulator [Acidovorax sp. 106]MCZ8093463.1 Rrf2 family transcriptional regulator [Acidovorax sp.]RLJ39294.1 BadM/Rrf2 family transcriptional regulator [Acidovorax sp. 106]